MLHHPSLSTSATTAFFLMVVTILQIFMTFPVSGRTNPMISDRKLSPKVHSSQLSKAGPLIFPGTKWCGPGNVAESENDLGSHNRADACCREHDMCPDYISAGDTKYGLTNNSSYTRVHCTCDERFHQCLHTSNSSASTMIGLIYFNLLHTKCFMEDHPIVECSKQYWNEYTNDYRCEEYITNGNQPTKWQWFDLPAY